MGRASRFKITSNSYYGTKDCVKFFDPVASGAVASTGVDTVCFVNNLSPWPAQRLVKDRFYEETDYVPLFRFELERKHSLLNGFNILT